MKKSFLTATAMVALLCLSSPAGAQYLRDYKVADKPAIEMDLTAIGDTDADAAADFQSRKVDAENLPAPITAAAQPMAVQQTTSPFAQGPRGRLITPVVEAVAAPAPIAPAPVAPAPVVTAPAVAAAPAAMPARQLLAAAHDGAAATSAAAAYQPYLTVAPTARRAVVASATPTVMIDAQPAAEASLSGDEITASVPKHKFMQPIVEAPRPKAAPKAVLIKASAKKTERVQLAENDFDRPQFQPTVDAVPAPSAAKPAIVSKPPSMPPAVLAPVQPRPVAPVTPSSNAPVETPPAAPPAEVAAPESLPAPVAAPTAPVVAAPAVTTPAAEPVNPPVKGAVIDEAAPVNTTPVEQSADTMPVVPTMADLSLDFSANTSDLSPETRQKLDNIVKQMNESVTGRVQVRGFATGEDGGKSSARRISLSRVLSVRSYLMDKGIKPARVDVRAMGTETDRTPLDRVDLIFVRD
ncbi:MAG: OmpA family protein [Micavibrio sp.]|nr:OmpA family protein [Micavibrio sp.]